MQSFPRSIAARTRGTDSFWRMSCMCHATCSMSDRFTSFFNRYVMHIIYCAQVCLCSHVVIDRLFSHSQYPSSLLTPNSAPQSHLHIGLPFGTPVPCLQLEQVMIRLGSFPPTLRVVSFTISVHEETTKLFPVWDCFTFHLIAFAVRFSSFSIALLYTPITSPYRMPFGCPLCTCRRSR
jgi:hypothetical protein